MNKRHAIIWKNLSKMEIDDRFGTEQFLKILAEQQGWSANFARLVLQEYKKFVFLARISKFGVVPSHAVDMAWHLHLQHTRH
jgi:hypothetical protein